MQNLENIFMGSAAKPVRCGNGVVIGNGYVIPEINFTLPQIAINEKTWLNICQEYKVMIQDICTRAVQLRSPALVVEFELLPPMTLNPEWGAEITSILKSVLNSFYHKEGLKTALRVTPVDIRENERPPKMRRGVPFEKTMQSFELCAKAGADILSIESTGGKELHDDALVAGDLAGIIFALGVLAVRDMQFLWGEIVNISQKYDIIPGGDTACGFANTAMILADRGLIPKILAAIVRIASVPRSLQAYYQGAQGPSKDCAYEGPYIKALTGVPISMEGKSSACAHLSSLGNIAAACCDLWSNESVQDIRLLSAAAPVVSVEQLIYDCRLMNEAIKDGPESLMKFQKWLTLSDAAHDPQAFVLQPEVVTSISEKLIQCNNPLQMVFCGVEETLKLLKDAVKNKDVVIAESELRWFDLISMQLESLPVSESGLLKLIKASSQQLKFIPEEYDL
jgi:methanol--5-hydroxybenzimidazolylcobamide Co-methyltransferase